MDQVKIAISTFVKTLPHAQNQKLIFWACGTSRTVVKIFIKHHMELSLKTACTVGNVGWMEYSSRYLQIMWLYLQLKLLRQVFNIDKSGL